MRWRLAPVCLSLILLAACTPKEPQPEAEAENEPQSKAEAKPKPEVEPELPEAPTPPVGSRVLIREARGLAVEAKPDAARVFGKQFELRIAEVVGHDGELVELRSVRDLDSDICGAGGDDRDFELHFFVARDELEPVLGKPKQVEFDDGTKLAFAVGVPIVGEGANARLRVGNVDFEVAPAADEIARWFQPAPYRGPVGHLRWSGDGPLYYGEHEIRDTNAARLSAAVAKEPIEGGVLLSFGTACGEFTLRADAGPEPEAEAPEGGVYEMKASKDGIPQLARKFDPDMAAGEVGVFGSDDDEVWGGLTGCQELSFTAPKGTKLLWRDTGTEAGEVIRDAELPGKFEELEDRVCFVAAGLGVCIESAQLRRKEQDCGYNVGGLGLIGRGSGGGSRGGSGAGFGGLGKRIPQVRHAKAKVSPGLDRDIVRRIVRAHVNEVRSCYNAGLKQDPELAGRVEIAFTIEPNGKVGSSTVENSELEPSNDSVGSCIAKAVERWTFPKPMGGQAVDVVYPFALAPG